MPMASRSSVMVMPIIMLMLIAFLCNCSFSFEGLNLFIGGYFHILYCDQSVNLHIRFWRWSARGTLTLTLLFIKQFLFEFFPKYLKWTFYIWKVSRSYGRSPLWFNLLHHIFDHLFVILLLKIGFKTIFQLRFKT